MHQFDPVQDPRWREFLKRSPNASVFHSPEWLTALRLTYGYEPVAFTTSPPGSELKNALVFCRVRSWLTGNRLVSLPFSDHCDPLVEKEADLLVLLAALERSVKRESWKSIEIRPRNCSFLKQGAPAQFRPGESYYFHSVNLQPELDVIFRNFQKDSIQRKIRRAEREGLTYEEGRSLSLLRDFYQLLLPTRRRQQLPPQPFDWFHNLVHSMGDSIKIRVASKEGRAIAAILTLSFKNSMVYKYGCSDERYHNLGGMPFLFWKAIQDARRNGAAEFDLGRSDIDNPGLIRFKDRWAAARSSLTYWRYPAQTTEAAPKGWKLGSAKCVFAHLPDRLLAATGKLLYRHIG